MAILEIINSNLKEAMQNKDELKVSVLRMLISAIRNKEISLRKDGHFELNSNQIVEVILGEIKKRKDSIASYEKGNRQDLAEKEKQEMAILEKYTPEQISDEEIENIVKEIISAIDGASIKDFGRIMGQAMQKAKGKADGDRVSVIVKRVLLG